MNSRHSLARVQKSQGRVETSKVIRLFALLKNLSLAALELFVHVSPGIVPADLVSVRGTLPDSLSSERIEVPDVPKIGGMILRPPRHKKLERTGFSG